MPIQFETPYGIESVNFVGAGLTIRQGWDMLAPTGLSPISYSFPQFPAIDQFEYNLDMRDLKVTMPIQNASE